MVLAIVMLAATLLLVALSAALPSVYQEGQREREEELIFRGTQYARAIALFHKQFNRYPVSIKELLQTNDMRFLRQQYRDPMDPKGKWRFIHVNAAGVLLDSKNQPLPNLNNSNNPLGSGQNTTTGSTFGGGSNPGGSSSGGFQLGPSSMGSQGGFGSNSSTGSSQFGPSSSFFGNQNQIQGGFIAGVAATSHHESIKVWQKHHHYDEWEFVGIDMGIFGVQVGMGNLSTGSPGIGQQNPQPGSSFSPGGFGNNSPTGFGNSPN
jgi:type II secretory pathway pseudopilin PulG